MSYLVSQHERYARLSYQPQHWRELLALGNERFLTDNGHSELGGQLDVG